MMIPLTKISLENISLQFNPSLTSAAIDKDSRIYRVDPDVVDCFKSYFLGLYDGGWRSKLQNIEIRHPFSLSKIYCPIEEGDSKDIFLSFGKYQYSVSFDKEDYTVEFEAISEEGKILVFRDRAGIVDYSSSIIVIEEFLDTVKDFKLPILFYVTNIGRDIYDWIKNIRFIDLSVPCLPDFYNFNDSQLEEINKVFPLLFSDSISKVLKNGDYIMKNSFGKEIRMSLTIGGHGYQNLLYIYNEWSNSTDKGGTLIVKHWKNSLHPLLRNAVLDLMKKVNKRNSGTLFLAAYED